MKDIDAEERARGILYRFGSLALADPRTGSWEKLRDPETRALACAAADLLAASGTTAPGPGEVVDLLPHSPEAYEERYQRIFGLVSSGPCPPHETDYMDPKQTFQRSHALADVAGFYRAFGLRPARRHPERPDHIVLELEFLAFLIDLEQRAPGTERAAVCRDAQKRFLKEHLAWWVPAFARLLAREDQGGHYAAAGRFLSAWIPLELARFSLPAPQSSYRHPSSDDASPCREGCCGG